MWHQWDQAPKIWALAQVLKSHMAIDHYLNIQIGAQLGLSNMQANTETWRKLQMCPKCRTQAAIIVFQHFIKLNLKDIFLYILGFEFYEVLREWDVKLEGVWGFFPCRKDDSIWPKR